MINYINQNLPNGYEVADKNYSNVQNTQLNYDNQSITIQIEIKKIPTQVEENSDIKISYINENGHTIASLDQITLKKGETKTRQELISIIKNNLVQGHELVDPNLSNITDITSNGNNASIDLKIQVKKVNVNNYNDIKISYQTLDQKVIKVLDTINLKKDETKSVQELKKLIEDQLPNNYKISKITGLDKDITAIEGSENLSHNIIVTIKPTTSTVTPDDVKDPEKEGFIKRITRTINIILPNGDEKQKIQTVTYQRNKIVTGDKSSWTAWELHPKSEKDWEKFEVEQFNGYRSTVNGVLSKVVADKEVYWDDQDETVEVGYVSDEKNYKLNISYIDESGNTIKNYAGIPLADRETLTTDQLKEIIDGNVPDYYEIAEDYEYPSKDITVDGKNPDNIIVKITKTAILPEDPDTQGELFKRITRKVQITKPTNSGLSNRTETQTITFSRKKVKVNNQSKANANDNWTYTEWQVHNGTGNTGKWNKVEVTHIPGYQAVIHYPKFELFTDDEDRDIEDYSVEEREVVLEPNYEDPNDMTREVFVSYRPLSSSGGEGSAPTPDKPTDTDPDNPGDSDKPTTDENKPIDSNSSSGSNNSGNSTNSSKPNNGTIGSSTTNAPNSIVRPLSTSVVDGSSTLIATGNSDGNNQNNYELPQTGSHKPIKTSTVGLISVALSTLLGGIGYLFSKRKK